MIDNIGHCTYISYFDYVYTLFIHNSHMHTVMNIVTCIKGIDISFSEKDCLLKYDSIHTMKVKVRFIVAYGSIVSHMRGIFLIICTTREPPASEHWIAQ